MRQPRSQGDKYFNSGASIGGAIVIICVLFGGYYGYKNPFYFLIEKKIISIQDLKEASLLVGGFLGLAIGLVIGLIVKTYFSALGDIVNNSANQQPHNTANNSNEWQQSAQAFPQAYLHQPPSNNYCTMCGAQLAPDMKFCIHCGTRIQ